MKKIVKILGCSLLYISSHSSAMEATIEGNSWNGKIIPKGQQCNRFGGDATTPPITIKNLPKDANFIVMSYNDINAASMNNGGHGILGYAVNQSKGSINIPKVPGHTFDLPRGFNSIQPHLAPNWDTAGSYMPPCSGGGGHNYTVKIEAFAINQQEIKLLDTSIISLGKY